MNPPFIRKAGIAIAWLLFMTASSGMIGLQVHGVKNFTQPQEIAWWNIRIVEFNAATTPNSSKSNGQRNQSP